MRCYELVIPRSRELVIPRSRATARPYGSRPHRRAQCSRISESQLINFYACARARGPASQQLREPAPLQPTGVTPELLCS